MFCTLSQDLRIEVGRYLHRGYYSVVLEELKLMLPDEDFVICRNNDFSYQLTHLIFREEVTIDSSYIEYYYIRWGYAHDASVGVQAVRVGWVIVLLIVVTRKLPNLSTKKLPNLSTRKQFTPVFWVA